MHKRSIEKEDDDNLKTLIGDLEMLEEAGQTDEENEDFLEPLNEDPFVPITFKEFITRWSKN